MPHQFRYSSRVAVLIGLAGWLVPGTGHLLLRLWSRGLAVLVLVAALAWTGVALRGRLFAMTADDFFDLLGFFADCGAGLFFYLAQKYTNGGFDVAHAAGDYGTRFFAAAGVLNVLAAVDAYRIARGHEHAEEEHEHAEGSAAADAQQSGADASANRPDADGADEASQLRLGSATEAGRELPASPESPPSQADAEGSPADSREQTPE
ncbi:MAG: DUF6677 family protein [Candidatus Acidiferrales bacterium]